MNFVKSEVFGKAVADALELDMKLLGIKKIQINCEPNDLVTIELSLYLTRERFNQIQKELDKAP